MLVFILGFWINTASVTALYDADTTDKKECVIVVSGIGEVKVPKPCDEVAKIINNKLMEK